MKKNANNYFWKEICFTLYKISFLRLVMLFCNLNIYKFILVPTKFSRLLLQTMLILLGIVSYFSPLAQEIGSPFSRNYHATEFKAHLQNWGITQDHRGVLYFANKEGVLEYDGVTWNIIRVNRDVRSLDVGSNGRIYVGAIGDLGYLEPSKTGKLEFVSLLNKLDTSVAVRNFEDIWKVYATQDGVYFQSYKWLARYKDGKFTMWFPKKPNGFHFSFWVRNKLYIRENGVGLMEMQGNELVMAQGGDVFAEERIYTILPYDSQRLLLGTRNIGLFIWNPENGDLQKFSTPVEQFIIDNQLYHGIKLRNGNFVLATTTGGAVVLNAAGQVEQLINKQAFLQSESVFYLYNDKQNNLWMGLEDGISNVEIESPWEQWNESHGLRGTVYSIIRHNKQLYVSTSQGAFYLYNNRFEQVEGIKGQTWDLLSIATPPNKAYKSKLLIGNAAGIYEVEGNKSKLLFGGSHGLKLYHSKYNPQKIYAGFNNSLAALELVGNTVVFRGIIKEVEGEIRNISEDDDGNIIINIPFRGLCVINPAKTEKFTAQEIIYIGEDRGFNTIESDVFTLHGKLFFTKNKKLYHFNEAVGKFEQNSLLDKYLNMGTVTHLANDSTGNIWMSLTLNSSKKEAIGVLRKQKDGSFSDDLESFKRLPQMSIQEVYPEDNGIVWIGGSNGLFRYNTEIPNYYNTIYHALIRKVVIDEDSVVFGGTYSQLDDVDSIATAVTEQPKNFQASFPYSSNAITFYFAAPYYTDENQTVYSYFLENFDKNWSAWHLDNTKEYTNLSEGTYTFLVKARNIYGVESKIASYSFRIYPPWYRTRWAYFGYVFFGAIGLWLILRVYTKRLQKEKVRLEQIVQERTAEIMLKNGELEYQKEEIIHQSKDLKVLNDEMAAKNQELEIRRAEIEKKNDDIKSSLNYSQRIQNALLPNVLEMKKSFDELFVLILPRDIVSGDFYWFGEVKKHRAEKQTKQNDIDLDARSIQFAHDAREIQSFVAYDSENYEVPTGSQVLSTYTIVASVDCTGHGVPGALMSMIGSNLMNEIILMRGIVEPNEILSALNLGVRKVLRQDQSKNKDGMDMALCVVDWHANELSFSGAKNPLMYVKNNEIIELKGDKKSIGGSTGLSKADESNIFSVYNIPLEGTMWFYMMSDGFEDQFGGSDNRKFMRKNLRELLHINHKLEMEVQNTILQQTITDWMKVANAHQIDDILVVGFKIETTPNARDAR
jgi:serine phosphatase RsbU (regulator of sigma subunit)/ligand-binding sensor domain-containing protein